MSAAWFLPDDALATLRASRPPSLLDSFDVTVGDGPAVDLSLTARNTTDVAGRFLAAVYWPTPAIAAADHATVVGRQAAGGGRVEWSTTITEEYRLRSGGRPVQARVEGAVAATADEVVVEVPTETTRP